MPYVNGQNLAPAQGLGLATVLKPDYTPLRILQQGDATRARRAAAEAAAKQKQAQEIAKQWTEDRKLGLDTGGLFQEPFNAYTANAQEVIGKHYADEQAGRITTAERIQNVANYKNEIERERLLGIDKDKLLANYETSQAGKPFRDIQGLHTALGETVLDPATGKRVRATAYDERANLTKLDADPRTYAADPIIGDYYKGLQASTVDEANAGRIGGIHSSSSLTYKGLLPVKRSDGTWDVKRDALGRPVLAITGDELATARASNHNLNMAVGRLRYEYDNQRQLNPALPAKSDLDLFQDASQKYVSFRQADSEGRNALPRAAAGSKPKITIQANTNTQIGGRVGLQHEGQALDYGTPFVFQSPTKTKLSTGETAGYGYDGALFSNYRRSIPGKDDEVITNNREPQNVQFGDGFVGLFTPTGKLVLPPKHLEGQALYDFWREQREKNPRLTIENVINGTPRKGKNELGDREGIADSLIKQYDDLPHHARKNKVRPTREQVLKEADDIIAKQNARYQFIYSDKHPLSEKKRIDAYAPGAYNSREKATELSRIRQEADEATRPRTAGERPKLRIGVGTAPVQQAAPASKAKYQMTNGKKKL